MSYLYGVIIDGVHPRQLVTVSDSAGRAGDLAAHLRKAIPDGAEFVTVEHVDSFYPPEFTDADSAWLAAADAFRRGA